VAGEQRVRIQIQEPLDHQIPPLADEARFKFWHWGRRAGKTRAAFLAATVGHGAKPNGKGFLQGGEVLWVARDYTQSQTIWYREIKPRFVNKPGFEVNEQKKWVRFAKGGGLQVVSAENIDSQRGGDWDGAVIDEAAHVDLRYIIGDVIRPGLADRLGWMIVMSTTKGGSYFNDLGMQIQDGERTGWHISNLTAFDNPKLDDDEVRDMIEGYGQDEVRIAQEVHAKLILPGGNAFPEWNASAHVATRTKLAESWPGVGALDWGYTQRGHYLYTRLGEEGQVYVRWELSYKEMRPYDVGFTVGVKTRVLAANPGHPDHQPVPMYIVADSQMFARTEGTVTMADEFQRGLNDALGPMAPALIPAPKGPDSRITGKVLVHQHLQYSTKHPDGVPSPWEAPLLQFHPDCAWSVRHFPRLPRSEKNPEDVDTKSEDHWYDALRYLLAMHRPRVDADRGRGERDVGAHHHPGFSPRGERRRRKAIDRALLTEDGVGDLDFEYTEPEEVWNGEWGDEVA
jgi:hypothetical protein